MTGVACVLGDVCEVRRTLAAVPRDRDRTVPVHQPHDLGAVLQERIVEPAPGLGPRSRSCSSTVWSSSWSASGAPTTVARRLLRAWPAGPTGGFAVLIGVILSRSRTGAMWQATLVGLGTPLLAAEDQSDHLALCR